MATQMMNNLSVGAMSTGLVCARVLPPWMEDSLRAISARQEEKAKEEMLMQQLPTNSLSVARSWRRDNMQGT